MHPGTDTASWLNMLSRQSRTAYDGKNLTVRRSTIVHAVAWQRGIGGFDFPVPACRVGVSGFDLDALHPTGEPVNCGRCRHLGQPLPAAAVLQGQQLALDLDADDDEDQVHDLDGRLF